MKGSLMPMTAGDIRSYGHKKYVLPARARQLKRFSIRVGRVVRDLKLFGHLSAVSSALKSPAFLEQNGLRIVNCTRPTSAQNAKLTYEFVFVADSPRDSSEPWTAMRGALKNIFASLGGRSLYSRGTGAVTNGQIKPFRQNLHAKNSFAQVVSSGSPPPSQSPARRRCTPWPTRSANYFVVAH